MIENLSLAERRKVANADTNKQTQLRKERNEYLSNLSNFNCLFYDNYIGVLNNVYELNKFFSIILRVKNNVKTNSFYYHQI